MRYLFFLVIWLLIPGLLPAQIPVFSKVFSNFPLNPENGWEIVELDEGYVLVSACYCEEDPPEKVCAGITRLNSTGDIIWFRQLPFYPNTGGALLVKGQLIYVCGTVEGSDEQMVFYCLDLSGEVVWHRAYGAPDKLEAGGYLTLTRDEQFFMLAGVRFRNSADRGEPILYFVKTNLEGDSLDAFTYGEPYNTIIPRGILTTTDGQIVFSYPYCPGPCLWDRPAGVSGMDEAGNVFWTKTFDASFLPGNCIVAQTDAHTIAAKWYAKRNTPNFDQNPPALYFMDLDGQVLGEYVFENRVLSDIKDIAPAPGGAVVGCGDRQETPELTNLRVPWFFRMNADRSIAWEREYKDTTAGTRISAPRCILPTRDGGYIIAGTLSNNMTGVPESHNWILKVDAEGCLQPGCGPLNILSAETEPVFLEGLDIRVSPNPASDRLQVNFPPGFKAATVSLWSVSGRLVQQLPTSDSTVTFEVSGKPAGTYYVVVHRAGRVLYSARVAVAH